MPRPISRFILLGGLLLTVLSVGLMIARRAPAQDSAWITYTVGADNGSDHDFHLITPDGRIQHDLLDNDWFNIHPLWASHGEWLIMVAAGAEFNSTIIRVDVNPPSTQSLLPPGEPPVAFFESVPMLSPDDEWVYFLSGAATIGHVYRVRSDGSTLENVTKPALVEEQVEGFALSPDGEWLALLIRPLAERFGETALVVMNVASGEITRLLDDDRSYLQPVWSPGSQWIVVASAGQEADGALTIISRDGQTVRSLVQTPNQLAEYAAWSPDGEWIAFARVNFRDDGRFQYYRVRPDSSDLQPLTDDFTFPTTPRWSSDSQWIAFNAGKPGRSGLYTMRADGSELSYLAQMPRVTIPAWSPPVDKTWWGGGIVLVGIGVVIAGIIGSREKLKKEL